jgi:hypothetical protein
LIGAYNCSFDLLGAPGDLMHTLIAATTGCEFLHA